MIKDPGPCEIRTLAEAVARYHDGAGQEVADKAREAVANGSARWAEQIGAWPLVRVSDGRWLAVVFSNGDWVTR